MDKQDDHPNPHTRATPARPPAWATVLLIAAVAVAIGFALNFTNGVLADCQAADAERIMLKSLAALGAIVPVKILWDVLQKAL